MDINYNLIGQFAPNLSFYRKRNQINDGLKIGIRITRSAENTKILDCDFVGCGIEDSGKKTLIYKSKFYE